MQSSRYQTMAINTRDNCLFYPVKCLSLDTVSQMHPEIKSERDREIFHLLVHSPNGYSGHGWARRKLGALNFLGSPTWKQGPKDLNILPLLPRQSKGEPLRKWSSLDSKCYHMGCWQCRQQLNLPCHGTSPVFYLLQCSTS